MNKNYRSLYYGFTLCLTLFFSIFFNANSYAQEDNGYANKRITLQVKNENLEAVLEKIGKLANVNFFYNHSILNGKKKVSYELPRKTLKEVIEIVLAWTSYL